MSDGVRSKERPELCFTKGEPAQSLSRWQGQVPLVPPLPLQFSCWDSGTDPPLWSLNALFVNDRSWSQSLCCWLHVNLLSRLFHDGEFIPGLVGRPITMNYSLREQHSYSWETPWGSATYQSFAKFHNKRMNEALPWRCSHCTVSRWLAIDHYGYPYTNLFQESWFSGSDNNGIRVKYWNLPDSKKVQESGNTDARHRWWEV